MINPSAISRYRRIIPAWGVSLLLASCAIAGRSEKRARMATALPSPTITPLSAPVRPTETLPPPLSETETPESVLACPERQGILRAETVHSSITGTPAEFYIYLPPCYDTDPPIRYPVLFLFHGLGRTPDQWHDLGLEATADHLIVSGRIAPLLIVLPSIPGEDSNDAVFLADLLPAVESRFRTLAGRDYRAIGGVSRGAEWALRLALRRADLFGAAGVHSISPGPTTLADIYLWAEAVPDSVWPRVYFDAGYSDPQLPQMQAIVQVFDLLKRPYEKHVPPGDHSDGYWSGHITDYLLWYAADWLNTNAPV
ncbi:MAG: alpha/beta hydrolase-fold protein [Anaerolineales bacterium]